MFHQSDRDIYHTYTYTIYINSKKILNETLENQTLRIRDAKIYRK